MNTSNIYNKHLNRELRDLIELGLDNGDNFVTIAKNINKKNNTISYEIKKHRVLSKGNHFNVSDDSYLICKKLEKPPYVCNGCPSRKGCRKHKYFYRAKDAQEEYEYDLRDSRVGINMNIQEFKNLNKIVTTEIKNGHSFSMICMNHKDEFPVKKRSLYNYLEKGYLDIANIDLPRKVRYKKRTKHNDVTIRNTKIRENRTYQDFIEYIEENHIVNIVEMDTVEGIKGHSVLLTLLWRNSNFMLIFKLEKQTTECVTKKFEYIKNTLGNELFYKFFPVILTDNGKEFYNPDFIEDNGPEIDKTRVFYCDSRASQQKGKIENNHEYIRRYIPKGKSFDQYEQDTFTLMFNHINSTSRELFDGKTPYEVMKFFNPEFMNYFNIHEIEKTKVVLNYKLLKQKKNDNSNISYH